jgi:SagB-type dehydrogenase family enzyme
MRKDDYEVLKQFGKRQILSCMRSDSSLSETFHENTKLTRTNAAEYVGVINAVLKQSQLVHMMHHADKIYSLVDGSIALPDVPPQNDLERAMVRRRSSRRYTGDPISLDELARLLRYTYGRTGRPPVPSYFRGVASGGALFPLEIYVAGLHVSGCDAGLYHYSASRHVLEIVHRGDYRARLREVLFLEGIDFDDASAVVVISAVVQRTLLKYQDRGFRMILLEAGEAAQNFALVATTLGLGCVWLGGFYDDELCDVLELDPVSEPVLLAGVVGRARPR